MTAAQEYDSVRSTADTESVYDGRTIPAGMRGAILDAKPDGSILAEFAFAPQTADSDGDFVQGVLTAGQYEVIWAYARERAAAGPFATLIRIAAAYLHPECASPARLRRRARRAEDDPEMRAFKEELREAILHPGRLSGDGLSGHVQQYESVRTLTAVKQTGYDGHLIRVIPAGAKGIIRHTRPDGSHTAELVTAPRPKNTVMTTTSTTGLRTLRSRTASTRLSRPCARTGRCIQKDRSPR